MAGLIAGDEAEQPDVLMQFRQGKFVGLVLIQIVEPEPGEVGDQHVARQVALLQPRKIVQRLPERPIQILAARLVLDQQHAFPQQINETARAVGLFDRSLERRHPPPSHPENGEEAIPEAFGLGILGCCVVPIAGKGQGAVFNFVPGQGHKGNGSDDGTLNLTDDSASDAMLGVWR